MADDLTPEQQAAIDAYWAAQTPQAEREAYARMMALGLPDGFSPQPEAEA